MTSEHNVRSVNPQYTARPSSCWYCRRRKPVMAESTDPRYRNHFTALGGVEVKGRHLALVLHARDDLVNVQNIHLVVDGDGIAMEGSENMWVQMTELPLWPNRPLQIKAMAASKSLGLNLAKHNLILGSKEFAGAPLQHVIRQGLHLVFGSDQNPRQVTVRYPVMHIVQLLLKSV